MDGRVSLITWAECFPESGTGSLRPLSSRPSSPPDGGSSGKACKTQVGAGTGALSPVGAAGSWRLCTLHPATCHPLLFLPLLLALGPELPISRHPRQALRPHPGQERRAEGLIAYSKSMYIHSCSLGNHNLAFCLTKQGSLYLWDRLKLEGFPVCSCHL